MTEDEGHAVPDKPSEALTRDRLDAVKRATAGNIDQKGGGYCYGCPHALDAEAFLADLRDEGFIVMPLGLTKGNHGMTGSVIARGHGFLSDGYRHVPVEESGPERFAAPLGGYVRLDGVVWQLWGVGRDPAGRVIELRLAPVHGRAVPDAVVHDILLASGGEET